MWQGFLAHPVNQLDDNPSTELARNKLSTSMDSGVRSTARIRQIKTTNYLNDAFIMYSISSTKMFAKGCCSTYLNLYILMLYMPSDRC